MKRFLKSFPLICLLAALLAGTAFADSGPKPQLVVKVVNAPQEPSVVVCLSMRPWI